MGLPVSVIDQVLSPPIGSLNPVRDTNGPFTSGVHTFTSFTTDGAFLLPAGTYDIHGTYGLIATPTNVPTPWGVEQGFDSAGFWSQEGWRMDLRWAQLVIEHQLFSGAFAPVEFRECHYLAEMMLWPFRLIGGDQLGLWVPPGGASVHIDYLCLL